MTAPNQTEAAPAGCADAWMLDPQLVMLNHGSFGACPRPVLDAQQRLRFEIERNPVHFFTRQMQPLLDRSREALCRLIGAEPADLVFTSNVTAAVNSVLRSLRLRGGDELLVTDHDYNACRNVAAMVAARAGAKLVVAHVPAPIESAETVVEAIAARLSGRTRIAVIDHVTSPTAIVFPIQQIVSRLQQSGVDVLVDGAHAPGMLPLDLKRIGAAYYAGACHKWLCAPKGAAFLHVRGDRQQQLQPPVISHGYNTPRPGRSRFQDAFDWPGTDDPTAWLCVGEAIHFLETLDDGGIEGLMRRNRRLVLAGRRTLCRALDLVPTCSQQMVGSIAALHLPDDADVGSALDTTTTPTPSHRLYGELWERFKIVVPVYHWPAAPQKLLRISAQAYNHPAQYERLADALRSLL